VSAENQRKRPGSGGEENEGRRKVRRKRALTPICRVIDYERLLKGESDIDKPSRTHQGSILRASMGVASQSRLIYRIQPTVRIVGKRVVLGRLMFGVTRGAMAFPRLLLSRANPIEFEVVVDAMFRREASE